MYILKNALVSITRNKGRNILIGIIILVIGCTTAVTLAIKNSSDKLISSYEDKYDVTASITVDRKSMMENFKPSDDSSKEKMIDKFSDISSLTIDDIKKYGNSDYVKSYYYTMSVGMNSTTLEKASLESNDNNKKDSRNAPPNMGGFKNQTSGDFTLIGYSSYEAMSDFVSGKYTITNGEISSDFESSSCIINSSLATLNNIKVGDTIKLVDPENTKLTYSLKVTGIFEEKSSDSDNNMSMFDNSVNTIITNVSVVNKIKDKDSNLKVTLTPTFVLKSKDVTDSFHKEITTKGLDENLTVTTNLDEISNATESIKNVSNFATTFLIITLVIGAIVLFVINMINIRERKYEIGVLRTIGMKKRLLTLQFMSEILIVAILSLVVGTGIGACISVPVSNSLLKNEITSSQEELKEANNNFGPGGKRFDKMNGINKLEEADSIDAVVDIKVISELLGIGIILILISSSAAMISIQRFSPLTILKERS